MAVRNANTAQIQCQETESWSGWSHWSVFGPYFLRTSSPYKLRLVFSLFEDETSMLKRVLENRSVFFRKVASLIIVKIDVFGFFSVFVQLRPGVYFSIWYNQFLGSGANLMFRFLQDVPK